MRSPSALYTSWWRCTRLLPPKAAETTSAWKCWPSPTTSTRTQARPASIPLLMLSGVTIWISFLLPQFVARPQHQQADRGEQRKAYPDHRQARERREIGDTEETVTKTVDHVEKR